MARDLRRRAAAAPKRTAAVVDDAFIVAGAAWAGLTAALGGDLVLVADHLRARAVDAPNFSRIDFSRRPKKVDPVIPILTLRGTKERGAAG